MAEMFATVQAQSVDIRKRLTIRFPADLLRNAREIKDERESLNDFVVDAVECEIRRRQGLAAYHKIVAIRQGIEDRTGLQPDSRPLIRALRDGSGRRD